MGDILEEKVFSDVLWLLCLNSGQIALHIEVNQLAAFVAKVSANCIVCC